MQINIIHDPNRVDRKVLLDSEIREHQLDVRLWPAMFDPVSTFRGINLAHKQVIRWAKEQKLPMVCVGEDDLKLTGKGAWEYFTSHIPEDFDIYLAGIYFGILKNDDTVEDFSGLHLYIVHERYYDCFLGAQEMAHIDRVQAFRGKFVVVNPFCAIQYDGWSDQKRRHASYGHILQTVLRGRQLCCDQL